ncbi:GAF domain-containing hybrid sensor histidine kinase/response regulator [Oceanospirillum beijerinckii]|uniref:GAF domain-containing hybrid sensor histidine kinase/response regulator n=1 Tax=Oceanospirillum beijerinckii TaxID=64976 RepID=UPI000410275E|nr:ATP-binding protein [Oceanospirillum beijerinckii]
MKTASLPDDEKQRLDALYDYDILDTEAEKVFDDLTQLASEICGTPIALISLIDPNRQWFKSAVGLDASETSRDIAFCSHAILQRQVFEIPDATQDDRFFDNPLVTGDPNIRFYAGAQLVTPDGYALGTLCAISDQPKTLTEQQRNALEILSREVVSQLELRKKVRQLEEASQHKTDFLSNMSHEVRNPINGILGTLLLLQDTPLSPGQANLVNLSIKSSESLLAIVNNVLDLSKIEAGMIELESTEFDLLSLLGDIAASHAVRADEKSLELICPDCYLEPSWVTGDPLRIRQILNNLVGNAIKFTDQGQIHVSVFPETQSNNQVSMRFEVRDSGIGLTEEQIGKLFNRYAQAECSTSRKHGGTGLGLVISKQLVEAMGGEIGVESMPGEGTTFWFTLPMQYCSVQRSASALPAGALKVLVLHGSSCYRPLLSEALTAWRIDNVVLERPEDAILELHKAAQTKQPYDLVLVDESLELSEPLRFTEQVTQDSLLGDLKCILLSHPLQLKEQTFYNQYAGIVHHPIVLPELYRCLVMLSGVETSEEKTQTRGGGLAKIIDARVLVVDDNETNQIVAKGLLEKYVHHVEVASHGREALVKLHHRSFDLILMDCQMPVMDGLEATRQIRQIQEAPDKSSVPIVALSANAMKGEAERCRAAGMDDYLTKPLSPKAIEECLLRWLSSEEKGVVQTTLGTPSIATQAFDSIALNSRLIGDHDLVEITLTMTIDELPNQLDQINAHLQTRDINLLLTQLHRLKGIAANGSAILLAELCETLEQVAKSDSIDAVIHRLPDLEQAISDFIQQAEDYLLRNKSC